MHDKTMTLDDYLASPVLADPFRMFDSLPDLRRRRRLRDHDRSSGPATFRKPPAWSRASGRATRTGRPLEPAARVHVDAAGVRRAARLRDGRATPGDVDVLTVYDPFTVVSMMQIEDMGFCEKGEAGQFVEGGGLHHDGGRLPFNTHGGLLSPRLRARHRPRGRGRQAAAGHRGRAGARRRGRRLRRLHRGQRADAHPATDRWSVAVKRRDFPLPDLDDQRTAEYFAGGARRARDPEVRRVRRFVLVPRGRVPGVRGRAVHLDPGDRAGRVFTWAVVRRAFLPRSRRWSRS